MIQYLRSLITAGTRDRVCAFLAVVAGISLCLGFVGTVVWMGYKGRLDNTSLITISGGLVALATFSKVDQQPTVAPKQETEV